MSSFKYTFLDGCVKQKHTLRNQNSKGFSFSVTFLEVERWKTKKENLNHSAARYIINEMKSWIIRLDCIYGGWMKGDIVVLGS